ncbi:poly(A) RNA polymerase, mitochondrial-like isoform X2 [Apostichopus japonicus]
MEMRKIQANNSILVRLCDRTPIKKLLQYCTSHGKISHHISYFQEGRYAVVEFESTASLEYLLQHTKELETKTGGKKSRFVHSRFLTFSKPEKQKSKEPKTILNKENSNSVLMNKLNQCHSVSDQIDNLTQHEQLREPEIRLRFLVCSLMEEAFRNILPNCTLYPFGSTVNTFGKRSCDIDMYLDRGTEAGMVPISQGKAGYKLTYDRLAAHSERVAAQTTLSTLASFLRNHVPHCGYVIRILNATCPLVKFKHRATGLSCDLTGDNSLALKSSELLYIYGQLDPRVRPLIFLVRYWARFHGITSVNPGYWITNFPLTLLVLYFLQTRSPPVVVTMNQLSRLAEDTESEPMSGMGCTLVSDLNKVPPSANEENLEQLLREFFQFLCSFSFQRQGVSVRRGEPFPNIDENVPLHIENPLETDLNTSKNVSHKLLTLMQTHAKDALKMMEDPAFQKSDDGNTPWGLPLMFLLPSHMERGSNKSMGLGNRLTNILKGISS